MNTTRRLAAYYRTNATLTMTPAQRRRAAKKGRRDGEAVVTTKHKKMYSLHKVIASGDM